MQTSKWGLGGPIGSAPNLRVSLIIVLFPGGSSPLDAAWPRRSAGSFAIAMFIVLVPRSVVWFPSLSRTKFSLFGLSSGGG